MDLITAIRNALERIKAWATQTYATKSQVDALENEVEQLEVASGVKGEDGFSPIVEMDKAGNTVTLRITDAEDSDVVEIYDGADGKDGYGITMVDEAPTYTEIQTDHPSYPSFQIPHGITPVKGVDYFTEADKAEMVQEVEENAKGEIVQSIIEDLQGLPVFGVVDENNTITVTSQLSGGTYILKYENADGTVEKIGTITIEGKVVIVNLLESALTPNDITTVFDGKGYMNGYYASAAEPFYNKDDAFFCAGLMVIPTSRTFYIKGCTMDTSLSHTRFGLMTEEGNTINTAVLANWGTAITFTELGEQYYSVYISADSITVSIPYYFYFSASGTGENVIVSATPIE